MVIILLVIALGGAALIWIWKFPIQKTVKAMKENGSSAFEAYSIIVILLLMMAGTVYMIAQVV